MKIQQELARAELERNSQEEAARAQRESGQGPTRDSAGSVVKHDKRDRTGSTSSSFGERMGKLKRVFSRKNGE